ncbi:MAG: type II toxin-antitoxin system MqsA family antitoxin [Deltaproteobacteria bacterium]|nr:type II toxin-antitoxin system MqsA family antitoxin [Deltaproteobacteria bacterium]
MNVYNKMLCSVCESGQIESCIQDLPFEYKGKKTVLPDQIIFKCPECAETFISPENERNIDKYLIDERRKIDGLLTSDEIKAIRKQYGMTQTAFAKMLRVAAKTFARYENGQVAQSYAMDNLLRILRKFPDAISAISNIETKIKNAATALSA